MSKEPFKFQVGDQVVKIRGYHFEGEVVAAYHTRNGDARYVVECTVPGAAGMQHIYNGSQLSLVPIFKLRVTGGRSHEKP